MAIITIIRKFPNILATRAVSVPDTSDYTDHIQSWDMNQVANKLGCGATGANGKVGFPGINQVVSMLPASPAKHEDSYT
jgi:hypothetical protein